MKHTPRDMATVLLVFASLGVTAFLMYLGSGALFAWFGQWALLALVAGFCAMYGALVLGYLKILNFFVPLKPGIYSMQDAQTSLWKHQTILRNMAAAFLRPMFPVFLKTLYYRIQGARIGKDAAVSGTLEDPMMTTLGDHSIVGRNACITAHALVFDTLRVAPVCIGRCATIGINAVIMPGVVVGDHSVVAAGAVVPPGTRIPDGELWGGMPAVKIKALPPGSAPAAAPAPGARADDVGVGGENAGRLPLHV